MVKKVFKITWTTNAELALKEIFDFYKYKSIQGALNVVNDIYKSPQNIVFSNQFRCNGQIG